MKFKKNALSILAKLLSNVIHLCLAILLRLITHWPISILLAHLFLFVRLLECVPQRTREIIGRGAIICAQADVAGTALLSVPPQGLHQNLQFILTVKLILGSLWLAWWLWTEVQALAVTWRFFSTKQDKVVWKEGISFLIPQSLSCCLGHLPIAKG